MQQRIHMHDQVFNKVDDIMKHYKKKPVENLVLLSHLQNYQPENSASQYQLPKSHFFNRAERESLFLAHDPIISSFLSKPGHNCPFNS